VERNFVVCSAGLYLFSNLMPLECDNAYVHFHRDRVKAGEGRYISGNTTHPKLPTSVILSEAKVSSEGQRDASPYSA
jgi:hypothetical protein